MEYLGLILRYKETGTMCLVKFKFCQVSREILEIVKK